MTAVDILFAVLGAILALGALYLLVPAVAALFYRRPEPQVTGDTHVVVLIPAHDEQAVIDRTLTSLLHQLRPRANVGERLRHLRSTPAGSAEEEVLARVEHSDVGLAFARLSPDLQAVVQATVLDGLTTREAAALLGIPSGTVKSRMSRARTELREALL